MPFFAGGTFKHLTAKDLDIYVVKVRYADSKRAKLLIWWVSKLTGQPVQFGGKLTDNIVVRADQYQYWSCVDKV